MHAVQYIILNVTFIIAVADVILLTQEIHNYLRTKMEFIGVGFIKSEPAEENVETEEFEDESFQSECLDIKTEVSDEVINALVTFYESPNCENDQDLPLKDETLSENGEVEEFQEVETNVEEDDNCETRGEFVLEQDADSARQEALDFREDSMTSEESSQESEEHSDWSQQKDLNADWPSDRKRRKISTKNTSSQHKQTFTRISSDNFGTHFLVSYNKPGFRTNSELETENHFI